MRAVRIALLIGLVSTLAAAQGLDNEYDYEEEEPAPAPVVTRKPVSPALRARAIPIQNSRTNKIPQAPVKNTKVGAKAPEPEVPPQPPQEEEEVEAEEGNDEAAASPEPSTEAPKRTIKPVVRPFRSNDDLLAALKRRRQQAQDRGSVVDRTTGSPLHTTTETPGKSRPNIPNKPNNNKQRTRAPSPTTPPQEATPKRSPPPPPRKPSPRLSRPAPAQQPEEDLQSSQESATRSKFARGSRRL